MAELIVIATHGDDWVWQCMESLPDSPYQVWETYDTYPTGAYLNIYRYVDDGSLGGAYAHIQDTERFLFIQDSMTCVVDDPLPWFRNQWPGSGAVAWQRFPMQWDNDDQRAAVEQRYTSRPSHGIFGPVFYTDRASLDLLAAKDLLPAVPTSRLEAQGSERAWAYAFADAGLPVVGPEWEPHRLTANEPVGPFRKVFAARP